MDVINFKIAKNKQTDTFLKDIVKESMEYLLKNVSKKKIRGILLTGSLANGEGTVIKYESSIVTSDFDFVIFLDFFYYLIKKKEFLFFSHEMTKRLKQRGIQTHVEFLPTTNFLRSKILPTKSNIYEYEFAHASKCIFGEAPSFNTMARPSKKDALELVFTVISELLFMKQKNVSKLEESYIYAKRSLTLLNSLLIFYGYFAENYEKRLQIVKNYGVNNIFLLNKLDLEIMEIYTNLKLHGSFQNMLHSVGSSNVNNLIDFQIKYLKDITMRILNFELSNLFETSIKADALHSEDVNKNNKKILFLLNNYIKNTGVSTSSYFLGVILYIIWSIMRNKDRTEIFYPLIFHRKQPKPILNVIITLIFVYGYNAYTEKLLKYYFPKGNYSSGDMTYIFNMYKKSDQYVKL